MIESRIKSNIQVSNNYYLMEIESSKLIKDIKPGRFINLKVNSTNSSDPLLRRPISIHDYYQDRGSVFLLYKIVGRGTEILSSYKKDEKIKFIGPLGNGFTIKKKKSILIIGGGMGAAPLYYLCKVLSAENKLTILLGANDKNELTYFLEKFKNIDAEVLSASIDGSSGYKGNVIELWFEEKKFDYDYLYACGPVPMLKRVQETAFDKELKGEVSLEERMGCGIGLCLSCVCKTVKGNQRICKEGPVFPLDEVVFE